MINSKLEGLEDHVVDYLASVTDLEVFGFTQTYLDDTIWETLQNNTQFTVVFVIASKLFIRREPSTAVHIEICHKQSKFQ